MKAPKESALSDRWQKCQIIGDMVGKILTPLVIGVATAHIPHKFGWF